MPAHVVNPNALAQYLGEVAAADHYSYLTALHGGVQRVLPSHTDHDASEYPANPTLVFISAGRGKPLPTSHTSENIQAILLSAHCFPSASMTHS
ncbi:hypothetical protein [Rhodococcus sp. 24CO]|uniref:hypothetical protein n=1 Tax=Rhodococcus sp. 24CO TaxID=3117460 RepID=UPI003D347383